MMRMGTSTITIHAPEVNLVAAEMINTTKVATAPRPFIIRLRHQPGVLSRHHRLTMPLCDNVNEANTPIV